MHPSSYPVCGAGRLCFALRLSRRRASAPNSRIIIVDAQLHSTWFASQDDTHGSDCLRRPHYLVGNSWLQSQVGLPRREFTRSVRRDKSHRAPALRVSSLRSLPRPSPARVHERERRHVTASFLAHGGCGWCDPVSLLAVRRRS